MNKGKEIIIGVMAMSLILSSCPAVSRAEDYPEGYLGPGHREYLKDKIRNGYYVEVFTELEDRQKQAIDKKNQIEGLVSDSYQANSESAQEIIETNYQTSRNAQIINWTAEQNIRRAEQGATARSEFKYIPYSDGRTVFFTDGLPTHIENERVVDELGNASIRGTYNMAYNDKRLLTGYEAEQKDNLGNVTRIFAYGIKYTPDSVFYADDETKANKHELEKYIFTTDHIGNTVKNHWQAISYEGKFLNAFSQTIEDSIYGTTSFTRSNIQYQGGDPRQASSYHEEGTGNDGRTYVLDRTDITYTAGDMVSGYHEEKAVTQVDGSRSLMIVDAQFVYKELTQKFGPDVEERAEAILLESTLTVTSIHADGAQKTETTTTNYEYDANDQVIAALGNSVFVGQEASWWEFMDSQGHILTRSTNAQGEITYLYINDRGDQVRVSAQEVTAALKEGNKFSGISETQYEILHGKPMVSQVKSCAYYYGQNISEYELQRVEETTISYTNGLINNLPNVLSTQEHTEISDPLKDPDNLYRIVRDVITTYIYNEQGNLSAASGKGRSQGWEYQDTRGWYGKYTSTIKIDYQVILGQPKQRIYEEKKDYEKTEVKDE